MVEVLPSRDRRVVKISVTDRDGTNIVATSYDGILPEEMLELLMEQAMSMIAQQFTENNIDAEWHGPGEKVQEAICRGLPSVPVRRS